MYTLDKIKDALISLGTPPGSWWHKDAPIEQDAVDFAREYLESCLAHESVAPTPMEAK
jgi:hypothetical protein